MESAGKLDETVAGDKLPGTCCARPTIGFLAGNVHVGAARALWPGVLDAAAKMGANLICYPGGRLQALDDFEAQRNIVYDLIDSQRLDGLVSWATTLTGTLGPDQVLDFHQRFRGLPMVSLAASLANEPTISIDSYQGMRAALLHLIEVHGFRRLALIRGPEGHQYAQERYFAFQDALRDKDIAFDPALVSPPVGWEKGAEAMRVLLDESKLRPGRDFEAVVAASDFLALGALRTLADRGIHVPNDVALIGFNARPESQLTRPPPDLGLPSFL